MYMTIQLGHIIHAIYTHRIYCTDDEFLVGLLVVKLATCMHQFLLNKRNITVSVSVDIK